MEKLLNFLAGFIIFGLIFSIPYFIIRHDINKDLQYKYKIWIRHHGGYRTNQYRMEEDCIHFIDEEGKGKIICSKDIEITKNK